MRLAARSLVLTGVLAGLLAGGLAGAQMNPRADWKEQFKAHDLNGDGRLDRAEFQEWMVDVFFARDQGKKGYLAIDDVRGAMTPQVFNAMNRNGDGKLSLPEFLNALFQDFQAIDTGRDGSITIEEIEAYIGRPS
jgi:Ca2+-binding EF-hand superfamily protein